jgi:hypothetical protein
VYDLNKLQWTAATPGAASQSQADLAGDSGSETTPLLDLEVMPPAAGHSVTPWQEQLLVLGGHTKVGHVPASWGNETRMREAAPFSSMDAWVMLCCPQVMVFEWYAQGVLLPWLHACFCLFHAHLWALMANSLALHL